MEEMVGSNESQWVGADVQEGRWGHLRGPLIIYEVL